MHYYNSNNSSQLFENSKLQCFDILNQSIELTTANGTDDSFIKLL